jgi:preprotein translocase subunit SecE
MLSWWTKSREFVAEVRAEMRKVSFPTRHEVVGTTVVVLITCAIFGAFLFVADLVIQQGYVAFVEVFGK